MDECPSMYRHILSVCWPGSSADGPPDSPDEPPLSKDVIFELLRVERRRLTVRELRADGPSTDLSTLARRLAAEENGIDVDAVSSTQRKRVYIALYQAHLPKLDDAGVVSFDSRAGTVEIAENASLLYPYLDLDAERPPREDAHPRLHRLVRRARRPLPLVGRILRSDSDAPSG